MARRQSKRPSTGQEAAFPVVTDDMTLRDAAEARTVDIEAAIASIGGRLIWDRADIVAAFHLALVGDGPELKTTYGFGNHGLMIRWRFGIDSPPAAEGGPVRVQHRGGP